VERLLSLSLIAVKRNRRGEIVCIHFRPRDGANPLQASCTMGQRYSFLERVGDGRCWAHKRMLAPPDEERDLYLRRVFRAVPLSIFRRRKTA
jgi:hypothetical protein